jgi:hypothetical protein
VHAELLKLGIDLSQSTVSNYLVRHRKPPSQTWRTFLENHVRQLISVDFFIVPTIDFKLLFVFLVLAHDRRRDGGEMILAVIVVQESPPSLGRGLPILRYEPRNRAVGDLDPQLEQFPVNPRRAPLRAGDPIRWIKAPTSELAGGRPSLFLRESVAQ